MRTQNKAREGQQRREKDWWWRKDNKRGFFGWLGIGMVLGVCGTSGRVVVVVVAIYGSDELA